MNLPSAEARAEITVNITAVTKELVHAELGLRAGRIAVITSDTA